MLVTYNKIKLPSNKKFGFFFSLIFVLASVYFFYINKLILGSVFCFLTLFFVVITILNAKILFQLNKLWMRFGLFLGLLISPIVIGFIFFGLITPYGIVMRIFGRDTLYLKKIKKQSYWIIRPKLLTQTHFNQQF